MCSPREGNLDAILIQVGYRLSTIENCVIVAGNTVVDVGANIGSFARLAAELCGHEGRVIAVEPLPMVME
jgi:23S rRNA U2552 (ribose-2'-O)-methylase RlmE/FtsJ